MLDPFLLLPAETTSPGGLFSSFNVMDPVQKAVISHTFGVSAAPKKKQIISCHVCQLRFNSDSQAEAHYRGSRHAKRIKSQQLTAQLSITGQRQTPSSVAGSEAPPSRPPPGLSSSSAVPPGCEKSEEEKAKKLLYCCLCRVAVNSLSQLEAHNAGSKHKTMQDARSGAGPIKAYPRLGAKPKNGSADSSSGLQNKTFYCQICDVHVNSEVQLKQHVSSRRHKDRVAGKPTKPKYSPYSKQHAKELVKSSFLPPAFDLSSFLSSSLSSFLSSSLSSSSLSSLSLHPRPSSSSFCPASFLRQAPGPIRKGRGSALFTPY